MDKNYNIELSMMRGICVLIVLMIHLLTPAYENCFIYAFSYTLQVFFFLSGYFLKAQPVKSQLKKRLWALCKPFLIYFLSIALGCGLIIMLKEGMTFSVMCRSVASELLGQEFWNFFSPGFYVKTTLHRPLTVTWFFVQLILSTAIAIPILGKCKDSLEKKAVCAVACLVASAVLYSRFQRMPLQLQMLFFEIAVIIMGNISRQLGLFTKSYIRENKTRIMLIIVIESFSALLLIANPNPSMMSHGKIGAQNNVLDVTTGLLQTVCGAIALYEICTLMSKSHCISKALDWVGSHSMEYVYIHLTFAWLLSLIGVPLGMDFVNTEQYSGSAGQMILLIALYLVNIALCTLFSKLISGIKENHNRHKAVHHG